MSSLLFRMPLAGSRVGPRFRCTLWPANSNRLRLCCAMEFLLLVSGSRLFAASAVLALGSGSGVLVAFAKPQSTPPVSASTGTPDVDWPAYNGNRNGDHASPLAQINRSNVAQLRVAWQYDTGEKGDLQTNPLVIGETLFGYTPTGKVVALDAATGHLLWTFDSGVPTTQPCRGFAYWTDGKSKLLFAGILNFLYALDPATGRPVESFGERGRIDLRKGPSP